MAQAFEKIINKTVYKFLRVLDKHVAAYEVEGIYNGQPISFRIIMERTGYWRLEDQTMPFKILNAEREFNDAIAEAAEQEITEDFKS